MKKMIELKGDDAEESKKLQLELLKEQKSIRRNRKPTCKKQ